ncbi:replication-relaxation family protein [Kitasatospora saccharophila]|uniref:replication-relaxation family protein n=1 Tax=Kitasatospora saccharophila TaxID=407973 RepID=UPI00362C0CEA
MTGDLETDHAVLVTLARFTLATAEQLHQLHGGQAGLKQTQKRLSRLHTEGLAHFVTLPQAGRAKAWYLTAAGASATAAFPETRRPNGTGANAAAATEDALRYGRSHFLNLGRIHCAFVADARARGESCGPLDLTPPPSTAPAPAGRSTAPPPNVRVLVEVLSKVQLNVLSSCCGWAPGKPSRSAQARCLPQVS